MIRGRGSRQCRGFGRKMQTGSTAMDVYISLPKIAPSVTEVMQAINVELGQYQIPPLEEYLKIPEWSWMEILTLGK